MKRVEAEIKAMERWSTLDRSVIGRAWLRCTAGPNCEVGFKSRSGKRGGWADTVLGRGRTWEEAFAHADEKNGALP